LHNVLESGQTVGHADSQIKSHDSGTDGRGWRAVRAKRPIPNYEDLKELKETNVGDRPEKAL